MPQQWYPHPTRMDMLRGWYASCVHAGGLSCSQEVFDISPIPLQCSILIVVKQGIFTVLKQQMWQLPTACYKKCEYHRNWYPINFRTQLASL